MTYRESGHPSPRGGGLGRSLQEMILTEGGLPGALLRYLSPPQSFHVEAAG